MVLLTVVKPFQYFLQPKLVKEPVPQQLESITNEILVPLVSVFHRLVDKALTTHEWGELEMEKTLHIISKCLYFSVKSHMPSALSPLLGSFCRDMIRILDSLSFDWSVTPSDGYLLRLKTGKRSLLLFGTLVSRHRKYSDKLVPEIVKCSMKIVKHSSNISKLGSLTERIISLAFDVISRVMEIGPGWRLLSPHFSLLLDSAIFPALALNERVHFLQVVICVPVFLVYCCADLFRLMVHHVFNDFSGKLLEDLRMIVGWGKCSSENWNLWVSNLQRAVDMKNEDEFSKDEIYDDYDKPSDEEWVKIETFARLVGCMYKVAVELFEGGYSTSNVYFYLLAELKVMLEKELEGADSDYFRCNAKWMLKRFDKYWDHMFLVLATASVLDPRFKMKYLEFYCSKNKVCDEASKAETVLDYLRSLYARYAASDICQKPICSVAKVDSKEEGENGDGGGEEDHDEIQDGEEDYDEEQGENEEDYDEELGEGEEDCEDDEEEEYDEEEDGEEKYDSDSSEEAEREARKTREKKTDACKDFAFFQEFLKFEGSAREFGEPELDCYLREPVMEWNKDFKALDWWREEGHKYPVLSRVSRDILSIPISRATSYYAYGMDRREPPAFVVSLEAEVANAMMCSKKWLRL
ncbi:hypothetical protein F2Q70_00023247 [Brassica cretica]|uniref:hAT-like transposase RNase-H fold domain-containing protein n=1 Tax=Brassica cretica TaxID=69181 RepID=A0A8S9GW28_BRACR|nr:hypothetical protein F2Q70_00023247 [Brassica cretica]